MATARRHPQQATQLAHWPGTPCTDGTPQYPRPAGRAASIGKKARRRRSAHRYGDAMSPATAHLRLLQLTNFQLLHFVFKMPFIFVMWIEEPTLLVTRFEYANLFHTITDWYSAYVSSRVTNLPDRPNVVFVDGHCKNYYMQLKVRFMAPLEQTWESLFSNVTYAKSFSGPVCFRHAVLSPLGYETALFKGLSESFSCEGASAQSLRNKPDHQKTARLSEFGEMIIASFDLLEDGIVPPKKTSNGLKILFVRREDYLAHPRHSGKVESRLSNEQEVFDAVEKWAKGQKCKITVVNGLFAHMSMKEQLQAILEASVIIGAHGAGLTHLVSATPDTKVLEIISSFYRRPHFGLISRWKSLEYHAINLPGSYASIPDVTSELGNILKGLGC
ncbi:hypothetical protein TRIUR3_14422 [Triticum urartu]|uniref:Glycosyltransferase 61 catalytic domain-containing protein n=2 Tax=Triticum TaxID=4564 RepID=A0A9R0ZB82_TRITD|nr:hypothetical protein TRIUR3_14422 [Triticum urartu]VAI73891.1 unnamed protein product [Triticum turgidum subsp. durum]